MKRFAYIDALRGYAVLGVVLVHSSQTSGFGEQAHFGASGVHLFFVASALTLMFSWHDRNDGALAFFTRRFFRIAPMFWLSIPIYVGLNIDAYTWQVLSAALFLQFVWPEWIIGYVVPGGWSVCAEIIFYCLFPLIVRHTTSFARACILVVLCFGGAKIWFEVGAAVGGFLFPAASSEQIGLWRAFSYPTQMLAFAAGILCYFAIPKWQSRFSKTTTEFVLAADLAWMIYLAAYGNPQTANSSLAFGILAICLANGAGKYLINLAVVHIGRLSFSIYLLHWICLVHVAETR